MSTDKRSFHRRGYKSTNYVVINDSLSDPHRWGGQLWDIMHIMAAKAPLELDVDRQLSFKEFLEGLPFLLPCSDCAEHCDKMLEENPLTEEDLQGRNSLSLYIHKLHNLVNKRLGKPEKPVSYLTQKYGVVF